MKLIEESANRGAARNFAKILAVIIVLTVAAFGDIMYIMEMQRVFTNDQSLLIFCYLGAFTSFMAIGYLLLGKSVVFAPGAQMFAAWIVFGAELLIIALNIMLVFSKDHTGFMAMWAFISPATPVFHMLGVAMIYFLDPEMKEAHRGLGITANDWEVFRAILGDTLEALRVPDRERGEIVDIAENLRADIVQG